LLWNMGANLVSRFIFDPWNIFDSVVVVASILSLIPSLDLPGVSVLRLLRVFRAVRLFRKLSSLRVLFNALLKSMKPVISSMIIFFIITAMYSILAVELYGFRSPNFQVFHEAIFSMYQVATGDSWAGMIARSLFYVCLEEKGQKYTGSPGDCIACGIGESKAPWGSPSCALCEQELGYTTGDCGPGNIAVFDQFVLVFFSSYSIITGMVLLNVVVAVLLDNFTRCVADEEKNIKGGKICRK